jgi:hypothetical protein
MKLDRRIALVATLMIAASLTHCKNSPTAPFNDRTYSVASPPVSVPAVPVAPVALATNDPNSTVHVTVPVTALQAIVQAAGGAVTVTLKDVAPTDYGTLPAGTQAQIGPQPLLTLLINFQKSSGAAADLAIASKNLSPNILESLSNPVLSGPFALVSPVFLATRCAAGTINVFQIIGTTSFQVQSATIDNSTPQIISGNLFIDIADVVGGNIFLDFECPITGGVGAAN